MHGSICWASTPRTSNDAQPRGFTLNLCRPRLGVDFFLPKEKGSFVDEDMASEFLSWWSENNGGSCLLQKRMLCNEFSCFVHTNSTDKGSRYSQWQLLLKIRTGDQPVPTKDHGHESARGEWRSGNRGNNEGTCGVTDVAALDWWPRERISP